MKKIVFFALIFLAFGVCRAADGAALKYQVGGSASLFSGPGLSFKYFFNDKTAAKIATLFYYDENGDDSSYLIASLGGEFQYYLSRSKYASLYALLGTNYWYEEDSNPWYYEGDVKIIHTSFDKKFRMGLGFGLEVLIWNHIAINLDGGYAFAINLNNSDKFFGLGGGIGVGYRF